MAERDGRARRGGRRRRLHVRRFSPHAVRTTMPLLLIFRPNAHSPVCRPRQVRRGCPSGPADDSRAAALARSAEKTEGVRTAEPDARPKGSGGAGTSSGAGDGHRQRQQGLRVAAENGLQAWNGYRQKQ